VAHAWLVNATHEQKVESHAYRFEFSNGLSATGVLFRSISAPEDAPITVVTSDLGMKTAVDDVGNDISRGQRVLVFDPLFFGENVPGPDSRAGGALAQMLAGIGQRPLGLEAAQVNAVIRWLGEDLDHGSPTPTGSATSAGKPAQPVHMITIGPRAQTVAMVAAALDPAMFASLESRKSIASLSDVFEHPQTYDAASELLCLDLYRDFDLNTLSAIAAPVPITLSAPTPVRIFWH
jgi:hypothetical protein